MTVVQGSVTGPIASVVRELHVVLDADSAAFAATDSIADADAEAAVIGSVRDEYPEREYLPARSG